MAGPWEKYAAQSPAQNDTPASAAGPWTKYQAPAEPEEPADTRTTGEKVQDIFIGNHPGPDWNRPKMTPEQMVEYKRRLPATLATAATMLAPLPAAPLAAIGVLGAEGAAVGALEPADSTTQRLKNAGMGAATSAAFGAAGEGLNAGVKAAWPAVKGFGAKLGELVTGTPKQEILTYAEHGPAIHQMMAQAGDNIPAAADMVREDWQKAIQGKKQALNNQIGSTLASSPKNATQSIQPILDEITAAKQKLNPTLHADAISELDDLATTLQTAAPNGHADAATMNDIKQYLQQRGKGAYQKSGQIFQTAPQAAQAAKSAGAQARGILNTMEPKVAAANNQLAMLHDLEDDLNRNLIASGKSDSAVMAAGAGANPRSAMQLEQLGQLTGKDMKGDAQKLAAARTFMHPKWDPREMTGKSLYRAGVGAALGGMAAHETGEPWEAGAVAGGLLASPAALKLGIDLGRPLVGFAQKVGPQASRILQRSGPAVAGAIAAPGAPGSSPQDEQPAAPAQQLADRAPARGEAAWAQRGLERLGITDQAAAQRLMSDPKARELLMQASDLAPGSRALKNIQAQIQKGWGRK